MILNKIKLYGKVVVATTILCIAGIVKSNGQARKASAVQAKIARLKAAVEANPDKLDAHLAYINAVGIDHPAVPAQYRSWMIKYPKCATVPFAIGKTYGDIESPKAKPFLLKAVEIDPKFAGAWLELSNDAQLWGDFIASDEYLRRAVLLEPSDDELAFRYAYSFKDKDEAQFRERCLDIAKRFPDRNSAQTALFLLAAYSKDKSRQLKDFESLKTSFPPDKFVSSQGMMFEYEHVLFDADLEKAIKLAEEMAQIKGDHKELWVKQFDFVQTVAATKKLIAEKKGEEAFALISKVEPVRYFDLQSQHCLLKAEALSISGHMDRAYDSLVVFFAKQPEIKIKNSILAYGAKLGKDHVQIQNNIWKQLDERSKVATPFKLKNYLNGQMVSLSDYKGKVVLLTYWFPGCGPCRGEFPHFENVMKKFKGKAVDYIGINLNRKQNDYVLPFMKGSGYSFTPLEESTGRVKGTLDDKGRAPSNFLIDPKGKVVFSDFMIHEDNEEQLEMMISLLLDRKV